jgi:CubicO group peptidase (beta-lactamase class C family)
MTILQQGTAEQAGMRPEQIELIRQRGAQWAEQDNTLGLQLLVARHGVVCLHEAWGRTTPDPDARPVTTDSYFLFASNTKVITAAAVMMLVEEGLLGLTRPVSFYIPEFSAPGTDKILVQQLLTHTSGYDWNETPQQTAALLQAGIDLPPCPANQHPILHASLHALCKTSPYKNPGDEMSYANENYELLGEIVRRVSGMRFADFLQERIFQPLGMDGVYLGLDPSIDADLVWDFSIPVYEGFPVGDEFRERLRVPHPAGFLFGRAHEYAAFAQMLLNKGHYGGNQLLHPITVAQMTRNQIPGIGTEWLSRQHAEAAWGYGLNMIDTGRWPWADGSLTANGSFTHGGGGGCSFWVDPSQDLLGVYFSFCQARDPVTEDMMWDFDLFQNMVTAAVVDNSKSS